MGKEAGKSFPDFTAGWPRMTFHSSSDCPPLGNSCQHSDLSKSISDTMHFRIETEHLRSQSLRYITFAVIAVSVANRGGLEDNTLYHITPRNDMRFGSPLFFISWVAYGTAPTFVKTTLTVADRRGYNASRLVAIRSQKESPVTNRS